VSWLGIERHDWKSQVQHRNHYTTEPQSELQLKFQVTKNPRLAKVLISHIN